MNNENKNTITISRKLALTFVAVIVSVILLFIIAFSFAMRNLKKESTYAMLESRLNYAIEISKSGGIVNVAGLVVDGSYSTALYYDNNDKTTIVEDNFYSFLKTDEEIDAFVQGIIDNPKNNISSFDYDGGIVYYRFAVLDDGSIILVASTGNYFDNSILSTIIYTVIIYIISFSIGIVVIIITVTSITKRINKLCEFVESLPENNYKVSYIDKGNDEIEILSQKIDKMRITINRDDMNRDLMLQNISHDLKTPIAVIRSYAEAIGDGIEEIEKTEIIISQANKLEKKVKNLIEFNKLDYSLSQGDYEEVAMAPIIDEVIFNTKYIANKIKFVVDTDDTIFIGKAENYYTVVENIVENGIRYAKKEIKVTLKQGTLTIHNDGPAIPDEFIEKGFRPYQKGSEGNFGLGMSIVTKTLDYFNMVLQVINEPSGGVSFIIYAK